MKIPRNFQIFGGLVSLFVAVCLYVLGGDFTWDALRHWRYAAAAGISITERLARYGWSFYVFLAFAFGIGAVLALFGVRLLLGRKRVIESNADKQSSSI